MPWKSLDAAAQTERPFLDAAGAASIDLGLHMLDFQFHYLWVLLARSSNEMKIQCINSSKQLLHLLQHLVSDSEEPFNGIIWQLTCCPFTPFLYLFGDILANEDKTSEENKEALAAMEQLPVYLGAMGLRHTLAVKLERIAMVFVQHARSVVHPQGTRAFAHLVVRCIATNREKFIDSSTNGTAPGHANLLEALPNSWPSAGNTLNWDSFFDHAITAPVLSQPQTGHGDGQLGDLSTWTNDFFEDVVVDWIGWDSLI